MRRPCRIGDRLAERLRRVQDRRVRNRDAATDRYRGDGHVDAVPTAGVDGSRGAAAERHVDRIPLERQARGQVIRQQRVESDRIARVRERGFIADCIAHCLRDRRKDLFFQLEAGFANRHGDDIRAPHGRPTGVDLHQELICLDVVAIGERVVVDQGIEFNNHVFFERVEVRVDHRAQGQDHVRPAAKVLGSVRGRDRFGRQQERRHKGGNIRLVPGCQQARPRQGRCVGRDACSRGGDEGHRSSLVVQELQTGGQIVAELQEGMGALRQLGLQAIANNLANGHVGTVRGRLGSGGDRLDGIHQRGDEVDAARGKKTVSVHAGTRAFAIRIAWIAGCRGSRGVDRRAAIPRQARIGQTRRVADRLSGGNRDLDLARKGDRHAATHRNRGHGQVQRVSRTGVGDPGGAVAQGDLDRRLFDGDFGRQRIEQPHVEARGATVIGIANAIIDQIASLARGASVERLRDDQDGFPDRHGAGVRGGQRRCARLNQGSVQQAVLVEGKRVVANQGVEFEHDELRAQVVIPVGDGSQGKNRVGTADKRTALNGRLRQHKGRRDTSDRGVVARSHQSRPGKSAGGDSRHVVSDQGDLGRCVIQEPQPIGQLLGQPQVRGGALRQADEEPITDNLADRDVGVAGRRFRGGHNRLDRRRQGGGEAGTLPDAVVVGSGPRAGALARGLAGAAWRRGARGVACRAVGAGQTGVRHQRGVLDDLSGGDRVVDRCGVGHGHAAAGRDGFHRHLDAVPAAGVGHARGAIAGRNRDVGHVQREVAWQVVDQRGFKSGRAAGVGKRYSIGGQIACIPRRGGQQLLGLRDHRLADRYLDAVGGHQRGGRRAGLHLKLVRFDVAMVRVRVVVDHRVELDDYVLDIPIAFRINDRSQRKDGVRTTAKRCRTDGRDRQRKGRRDVGDVQFISRHRQPVAG